MMATTPEQDDVIGRLLQIKGTASTILLVLLLTNKPYSKQQLHSLTGISHKPIRRALNQLQEIAAVREDEYHLWRISEVWRYQIIALMVANNTGMPFEQFCRSFGTMSPSLGSISPSRGTLSLPNSTLSESHGIFSPSVIPVVVDNMSEEINKDLQQQQSFNSVGQQNSVEGSISPVSGAISPARGTISPSSGSLSSPVGALSIAKDPKTDSAAVANGELPAILRRMGVVGRVKEDLLARQDLIQDPTLVLAWWWYSLAQERVRDPVALAIHYLRLRDRTPAGFLALVRLWPKVNSEDRLAIEDTLLRYWSAEELRRYWSEIYPEWSADAFIALKELYLADPAVLEL